MRLHADDLHYLHELGNGNVSSGLRACIQLAQQQQQLLQLQLQQAEHQHAQHTLARPGWLPFRTRARGVLATLLPH